jgi:hypothetical protein
MSSRKWLQMQKRRCISSQPRFLGHTPHEKEKFIKQLFFVVTARQWILFNNLNVQSDIIILKLKKKLLQKVIFVARFSHN